MLGVWGFKKGFSKLHRRQIYFSSKQKVRKPLNQKELLLERLFKGSFVYMVVFAFFPGEPFQDGVGDELLG